MNPTHEAMIRKLIEKTLSHQYRWRKAIKADSEIIEKLKTKEPTADMSKSYILEQDKQKFVILADSNRTIFYLLIINEKFNEPLFTSTSSLYQLYTIVEGMVRSEMSSLDLYLENLIDSD